MEKEILGKKKKKKTWGRRSGSLQGFGVDPDLALLWCWSHKALTTKDAPRPTSTGSCGAGHIKEDLVKKILYFVPYWLEIGHFGGIRDEFLPLLLLLNLGGTQTLKVLPLS